MGQKICHFIGVSLTVALLLTLLPLRKANSAETGIVKTVFKINQDQFGMKVPNEWRVMEWYLGVPVTFIGPKLGKRRPVVSIVPTQVKGKLGTKSLWKGNRAYEVGRLLWLKDMGGKLIGFLPYELASWKKAPRVHSIGYQYRIGEQALVERSYWITCNSGIYLVKTLLSFSHIEPYGNAVQDMVKSFSCE